MPGIPTTPARQESLAEHVHVHVQTATFDLSLLLPGHRMTVRYDILQAIIHLAICQSHSQHPMMVAHGGDAHRGAYDRAAKISVGCEAHKD
ncbi:hypothetical protein PsYK624_082970 [Phanerochaete sordida]|uniref:Uncharacterized protein n=1 Tax=Phanerochaete sordida TaxID=48140 RepID=A0A9P3GD44_9APHY|nr:hypothetical protein PsYK624_082970 [Phanerochaete sordida]